MKSGDEVKDLVSSFAAARAAGRSGSGADLTVAEAIRYFQVDAASIVQAFLLETATASHGSHAVVTAAENTFPVNGRATELLQESVAAPAAGHKAASSSASAWSTPYTGVADDACAREPLVSNTDAWAAETTIPSARSPRTNVGAVPNAAAASWGFREDNSSKELLSGASQGWGFDGKANSLPSATSAWETDQGDWGFQKDSLESGQTAGWPSCTTESGPTAKTPLAQETSWDYQAFGDPPEDNFSAFAAFPESSGNGSWPPSSTDAAAWPSSQRLHEFGNPEGSAASAGQVESIAAAPSKQSPRGPEARAHFTTSNHEARAHVNSIFMKEQPESKPSVASQPTEVRSPPKNATALTPIDDTADEVTRHLLCARSKIEAVEVEFAHIMGELAAYSERIPVSSAPARSPHSGVAVKQHQGYGVDAAEYYFVGTPGTRQEESTCLSGASARQLEATALSGVSGRQLVESLCE
jgi:hypothetical protein